MKNLKLFIGTTIIVGLFSISCAHKPKFGSRIPASAEVHTSVKKGPYPNYWSSGILIGQRGNLSRILNPKSILTFGGLRTPESVFQLGSMGRKKGSYEANPIL